jgi:putative FmdB family regulatory protein
MPVYAFRCDVCQKEFDAFLTYDELDSGGNSKLQSCPKCDSYNVRRIIKIVVPVIYRGDGFTLKKEDKSNG